MNREQFNQFCRQFSATSHVVQWGNSDVWKVGGKVFAIAMQTKEGAVGFTFKVSALNFAFLSEHEGYRPAPYFASRGMKWIQQTNTTEEFDEALRYYLSESYRIVAGSLSRRKQLELGIVLNEVERI